jgi:hypothetical protein
LDRKKLKEMLETRVADGSLLRKRPEFDVVAAERLVA